MSLGTRRSTQDRGRGGAPRARAALRLLKEANVPVESHAEWLLESLVDGGKQTRKMPIAPMPFRIGRVSGFELVLPSQLVSKSHAEIYEANGSLRLRDLQSTNGTFVNRKSVEDVALHEGDIIHFADFEFRVGRLEQVGASGPSSPWPTCGSSPRTSPSPSRSTRARSPRRTSSSGCAPSSPRSTSASPTTTSGPDRRVSWSSRRRLPTS